MVPPPGRAAQPGDRLATLHDGQRGRAARRRPLLFPATARGTDRDRCWRPDLLRGLPRRHGRASRRTGDGRRGHAHRRRRAEGWPCSGCCGARTPAGCTRARRPTPSSPERSPTTAVMCSWTQGPDVLAATTRSSWWSGTPPTRDRDVAFVGGIDLGFSRGDDSQHLGDEQVMPFPDSYGPRPAWHDIQAEVRGTAIHDLEHTFRERWYGSSVMDVPSPLRHALRPGLSRGSHDRAAAPGAASRRRAPGRQQGRAGAAHVPGAAPPLSVRTACTARSPRGSAGVSSRSPGRTAARASRAAPGEGRSRFRETADRIRETAGAHRCAIAEAEHAPERERVGEAAVGDDHARTRPRARASRRATSG